MPKSSPQPARPKVFISYYAHGTDLAVATALRAALVGNRVKVPAWRDKEALLSGSRAIHEVEKGIDHCDFFLLLVSRRSMKTSLWCPLEWRRAFRLRKPILPLILEDVDTAGWPLELEEHQWLDLRRGVGAALPELLQTLGVSGTEIEGVSDPLDRDEERMKALASVFFYFASNPVMPVGNVQVLLEKLKVCMETSRAKEIVVAAADRQFSDCRAAGNWMLDAWNSPGLNRSATKPPSSSPRGRSRS
jgi:hypothetical protein